MFEVFRHLPPKHFAGFESQSLLEYYTQKLHQLLAFMIVVSSFKCDAFFVHSHLLMHEEKYKQ